ncbi:MAG TPA: PHP domain-containing protein [Dehalococcoidales bacterium]|nr:PHP domain-containing protein [Dehalococcoidales bacterium]
MSKVDLHIHTSASDGKYSAAEIVRKAWEAGLTHIAICDHDSIDGIMPALEAAKEFPGLTVIPGVEINTDIPAGEMHVLGYLFEYQNQELHDHLIRLRNSRVERARKMIGKLRGLGVKIDYERVEELAAGGSLGRPHIAQALLERGYVNNFREAFIKYIGRGSPAYIERDKITPVEAVKLIVRAGGTPVLAHPFTSENYEQLITKLIPAGLLGLEAYYNNYTPEQVQDILRVATGHNLIVTGGSDYHGLEGLNEPPLGSVEVPLETVNGLLSLAQQLNKSRL